jgi:ribosome-associated toxin RatA of RatAB toxin-antitoxin module
MFTLDFRFTNAVYASLSGIVFNQIVNKMVCAFLKRAEQLHGPAPEIREYDCDPT